MAAYTSAEQYLNALERKSALPEGFSAASASLTFKPREKPKLLPMNLSLILLDEPTPRFAGRFTRNRFTGAPVLLCRERMRQAAVRGVLINNRIANVGTSSGVDDARAVLRRLAELLQVPEAQLLSASTGIVGWQLPVREMQQALPALAGGLQKKSILPVARAMMTTDSYPKVRRVRVGEGSIVGVAKGAGMIEPNLATMLVFLLTDLSVERDRLREELAWSAERSFNRISVDGDQSTSDMAIALSSGRKPAPARLEFREALLSVCRALAEDIVRNGEGVAHVIRVLLSGLSEKPALGMGKAIVNSPLVKTAVFGNDPNVGRILSAIGDYLSGSPNGALSGQDEAPTDIRSLRVSMGGIVLFDGGGFRLDPGKEKSLSRYLKARAMDPTRKGYPQHERCVEITVELPGGKGELEVIGADLSYEYVRENADYRS